jgi:hypothetical protein
VSHTLNSTSSPEEADAVAELIGSLLGRDWTVDGATRALAQGDLIVVAPYNAQVEVIRQRLALAGWHDGSVGTVDKFQGREAAVAIVSLAASSAAVPIAAFDRVEQAVPQHHVSRPVDRAARCMHGLFARSGLNAAGPCWLDVSLSLCQVRRAASGSRTIRRSATRKSTRCCAAPSSIANAREISSSRRVARRLSPLAL